jgi:Spy/CpxP family protein refolding chaperone
MVSMLALAAILGGILLPAYSSNFFERSNDNGIDVPGDGECPHKGPRGKQWMGDLTEDQRAEIRELKEEMIADGASKEEIRDAVKAKLEQMGIEVPEFKGPRGKQWMGDLTEDQRAEIRDLIEEMKDDGASKEEIREAIQQLLEE